MSKDIRSYDAVAVSAKSTVVAEYVPDTERDISYQSEAQLENEFIAQLQAQAYEYADIRTEDQLIANLRTQLEKLNNVVFSDNEWHDFFTAKIASANDTITDKTTRIQEDYIQLLRREDGSTKNIRLIDKDNIHNNRLQVINQYGVEPGESGARYANRYDVTVLVNGLPLVHIELKRRGVPLRQAFNQIQRYQEDSFSSGSGLFDYVQIFVISNGTSTKYYSNTTRQAHLDESGRKDKKSFVFTSYWADATNRPIEDLIAFAKTFFAKHSLLNVLTRYCIYTENRQLMVMRPYQIVATERILNRILVSSNNRKLGTINAGGYIWHTTGSGKTLTSFKTAQLASRVPGVEKVLFVVDRKDLDYQTIREYDRFEKGAANGNKSTAVLKRQLEDPNVKIIVTTIQKLATFVKSNRGHAIYSGHVVLIFDECHRSQFGDMHAAIKKAFKKYNLFGFTGTPIFAENAGSSGHPGLRTTEQAFGDKLHTYTIVDAITDKNVLPFRIDYINTIETGDVVDKQVRAIDTERVLLAHERLSLVVDYILEHFDQKTKRNSVYMVDGRRKRGFNALFATASIDAAKRYYEVFKEKQAGLPEAQRLKVGIIYSFGVNEDSPDGIIEEEIFSPELLGARDRDFLEMAIADYNAMYATNFNTSSGGFQDYYVDMSRKLKERDIDLVIVVNMFLTGFDAPTLNTLFVDKNLRSHGLIQAFSRTNRILNSVKAYGNVVSFRNLDAETTAAISLFGNKDAGGIVVLKPYAEYFDEYAQKVADLRAMYPLGEPIVGEENQKEFIKLYGAILRLRNILTAFDDFGADEMLSPRDQQDYQSRYMDIYDEWKPSAEAEREDIRQDVIFEIELIKQVEINVDYILMLVEKRREERGDGQDKEIRAEISRAIDSSPSLRNKKDLIEQFVDSVSLDASVQDEWQAYVEAKKEEELARIIAEERLKDEQTRRFMQASFRNGEVRETGTAVVEILPAVSMFARGGKRGEQKSRVLEKLKTFFARFSGLGAGE
ncbi:MAG: type I restriction endonuclease subunit R [Actinomycetaceae bacterium]|nr:type I restriction endonuclease subunit R [Actinomycetaceae bacterium]